MRLSGIEPLAQTGIVIIEKRGPNNVKISKCRNGWCNKLKKNYHFNQVKPGEF